MKDQNTLEIDVFQLFRTLWKRKLVILLVAIITSSVAFAYSTFVIKPEFTSTTRIYVVNRNQGEKSGLTNQDLQAGSYLVKDYREIILSQDVLEKVVSDLKLDLTPKGLANKIKVTVPVDTRIVSISVNDRVPEEASRIANSLREVAAQKIISITRVSDVTTLEEARPAISPSSPNIRRNTVIGAGLGAGLVIVVVLLIELFDDRVKRPEDIEDVMEIPLLGIIPNLDKVK
ncbi:capsular polysaccharide biosynthesis protein CpsC [Streptococcus sp. 27098_8_76]|jgi:polysaccharide export protein, MPA1 family|uniref:capsular polysaccharide biosynthesis protein CpsC n=1 Tax=Streptococcus TaxID=1301 RepID=UPI00066A1826|nr:capsular polysaccharide biosynthesis protein CpsC [Streptococcus mitis]MQQ65672.1 capsular polysaccharide biosynthesis protein CpsC [Streptococcus mitis]